MEVRVTQQAKVASIGDNSVFLDNGGFIHIPDAAEALGVIPRKGELESALPVGTHVTVKLKKMKHEVRGKVRYVLIGIVRSAPELSLERHFSAEEIEILVAITSTQLAAETSAELPDGEMENPYQRGMFAWVEEKLSSEDAAFMALSKVVAEKYDALSGRDKERALHKALIERVLKGE